MKIISMRLENEEHKRLKATAEEFGMSVSAYIRMSCKEKSKNLEGGNSFDEMADQIATEFQASRNDLTNVKRELVQTLLEKQSELVNELSKQLNTAFAFELDRIQKELREDSRELIQSILLLRAKENFDGPTNPPTR